MSAAMSSPKSLSNDMWDGSSHRGDGQRHMVQAWAGFAPAPQTRPSTVLYQDGGLSQMTHESHPVCANARQENHDGTEAVIKNDSIVLKNKNTTIGYLLFNKRDHVIDYIFVHPGFLRQGFGGLLVSLAQRACGTKLNPAPPVSPLGRKFFENLSSS